MIDNVEKLWQAIWVARLFELRKSLRKEIMPFPEVRTKLCTNFHLEWSIVKRFLHKLWEEGYIDTIPCHGIKLTEHAEILLVYLENTETAFINKDIN